MDFSIADEPSGTSVRKSYHIESYSLNDTNYILYHIHFKIQTHPKLAWKIKSQPGPMNLIATEVNISIILYHTNFLGKYHLIKLNG